MTFDNALARSKLKIYIHKSKAIFVLVNILKYEKFDKYMISEIIMFINNIYYVQKFKE